MKTSNNPFKCLTRFDIECIEEELDEMEILLTKNALDAANDLFGFVMCAATDEKGKLCLNEEIGYSSDELESFEYKIRSFKTFLEMIEDPTSHAYSQVEYVIEKCESSYNSILLSVELMGEVA